MKKESIVAIIFGIGLGVMVAFLVIFHSKEKQLSQSKPLKNQKEILSPKVKIENNSPFIEVIVPDNQIIVDNQPIVIKGKANKNSLIIIQSPIIDLVFKNNKEEFEQSFPLVPGENVIEITNYPEDKNIPAVHKQLKVYYLDTKEKLE